MLALYLTGPLTHGDTPVVDVTGDDTLRDLRQKAVCELAIDVDADDIDMVHGECDLSDVSAKICETGLGEGDSVEVRCSRRFEARRKLEELGVGCSVEDLRDKVLYFDAIAASEGEKAGVLELMVECDSSIVNARDQCDETPLLLAAARGNVVMVTQLLAYGADPNTTSTYGGTPLLHASYRGYTSVVRTLLSNGADPQIADFRGDGVHTMNLVMITAIAVGWDRIPAKGPPPDPRFMPSVYLDGSTVHVVGGVTHKHAFTDVWAWGADGWRRAPGVKAEGRIGAAGWADSLGNFHLFAGRNIQGGLFGTHKYLSKTTGTWVEVSGDLPPLRWNTAYCKTATTLYLYGGKSYSGTLSDLWAYNLTAGWTELQITTQSVPPGLYDASMACDTHGVLYLTGGVTPNETVNPLIYVLDTQSSPLQWKAIPGGGYTEREGHFSGVVGGLLVVGMGWNSVPLGTVNTYNTTGNKWTTVPTGGTEGRDYIGYSQGPDGIWVFGGWGTHKLYNDLLLLTTKFELTVVQAGVDVPKPRAWFGSAILGNVFYIHAGLASYDAVYRTSVVSCNQQTYMHSDMWVFAPDTQVFTVVDASDPPPGRYLHTLTPYLTYLLVFGGRNTALVFADTWRFSTTTLEWVQYAMSASITPRYNHAATSVSNALYVFGGQSESGATLSDLWKLDLTTWTWTELFLDAPSQVLSPGLFPVTTDVLIVVGTSGLKINLTSMASTPLPGVLSDGVGVSDMALGSIGGGRVISQGGEAQRRILSDTVVWSEQGSTQVIPEPLLRSGHSMFVFGNSVYLFGGFLAAPRAGRSQNFLLNEMNVLHNQTWIPCTPGTHMTGTTCTPCGKGEYTEVAGEVSCKKCPKGWYGTMVGQSSVLMCVPCEDGAHNDVEGAAECKVCPNGSWCPVGAATPHVPYTMNRTLVVAQPFERAKEDSRVREVSRVVAIVVAGCIAAVSLLFLVSLQCCVERPNEPYGETPGDTCSRWLTGIYESFTNFDWFFGTSHHYLSGTYVKQHTSPHGGLLTVTSLILFISVAILSLLSPIIASYEESHTLLPYVTYNTTVTADIEFTLRVITLTQCDLLCTAVVNSSGLTFVSAATNCNGTSPGVCTITWGCSGCQWDILSHGETVGYANVTVTFPQRVWAAGYGWDAKSTSGVPGGLSTISNGSIMPANGSVFFGHVPTVLDIEGTPTKWEKSITGEVRTGVHLHVLGQYSGSQHTPSTLNEDHSLQVVFKLTRSENLYTVTLETRQFYAFIISILIGIFPGVAVIGGVIMYCLEVNFCRLGVYQSIYTHEAEPPSSDDDDDDVSFPE